MTRDIKKIDQAATPTEKKKRIPKPQKNIFIDSAIEMIPMLNLNLDKTNDEELLKMVQALENFVSFQKNDGKHVRETVKTLQKLSRILLSKDTSESAKYKKWVEKAISEMKEQVSLGCGDIGITKFLPVLKNAGKFFRAKRTWQIIKALERETIEKLFIGGLYLGKCKRCEKIYEKARGDQDFCGKPCKNAEMIKRFRKK